MRYIEDYDILHPTGNDDASSGSVGTLPDGLTVDFLN